MIHLSIIRKLFAQAFTAHKIPADGIRAQGSTISDQPFYHQKTIYHL